MTHDRNNGADTEHAPRSAAFRPGAFRPGNSGRPRGARNRTTLACLALLEGEGEALTCKAVELALAGDTVALKLCLERLLPKGRAVRVDLPLRTAADLDAATETIGRELAGGRLALDEVGVLTRLVEARREVIEVHEIQRQRDELKELARERKAARGTALW